MSLRRWMVMMTAAMQGGGAAWTPESPTDDGGVSAHTWHYPSLTTLYQDNAKTTPVASDDDPIGASVNQGSDSHDIVQATAGNKPTYKTGIINGKPAILFDGGDWLQGAFAGALSQPCTLFIVAKLDAAVLNNNLSTVFFDGDDATNRQQFYKTAGPVPDALAIYAGAALTGSAPDADWHIYTILFNGASSVLWRDGTVVEVAGNAGASAADGLTLGGDNSTGNRITGYVRHRLGYPGNLSDADKDQIGNYLANDCGLAWTNFT